MSASAVIIDDEVQIRRLLRMALEARDYKVFEAENGQLGLSEIVFRKPDVVILDLGLPDMDGLAVLQRVREWSQVPVLVLSVRDQEVTKVAALEQGADDYVTKPFSTSELIARLHAIQRRAAPAGESSVIICGALALDLAQHHATLHGLEVKLTPTEYALLKALATHAGRIVTQKQLLQEVWGDTAGSHSHSLRVYINMLRKKLPEDNPGAPRIMNEPGIGYRLVEGKVQEPDG
jgi:two-component system, OmpR family, KDP operon response regulator KdpE